MIILPGNYFSKWQKLVIKHCGKLFCSQVTMKSSRECSSEGNFSQPRMWTNKLQQLVHEIAPWVSSLATGLEVLPLQLFSSSPGELNYY